MGVATQHQRRVASLRDAPSYQHYRMVRDWVLSVKEHGPGGEEPSDYWQHELGGFEYMLDASPLIIEKLRHHTYHVTGVRVYDYRAHRDKGHAEHAAKLQALHALGHEELLVPEARDLGGFGFEIDGGLINVDTLKFYEVLIAMERGGILPMFRESGRRVVWEIGAGWGGFAYQFKTLFPDTTYVITDLPELFTFSATYLLSLFPDASVVFVDGNSSSQPPVESADFVFVASGSVATGLPPIDLTVNMVSFQEMTAAQVRMYVRAARNGSTRFLYSLNRDYSNYNKQVGNIRDILSEQFWLYQVPVLDIPYTRFPSPAELAPGRRPSALGALVEALSDGPGKATRAPGANDYRHVIGWPRSR